MQQRVSLILNSLEGLIKRTSRKNDLKIPIFERERKIVLDAVLQNALEYVKSEQFSQVISSFNRDDLDIKGRIRNSLIRFSKLTFDEMLEFSKKINQSGLMFVRKINPMPVKFWKRCKDHRNFHAHLSDNVHKGFNGVQSVYAVFILSNYFRLLILELTDIKDLNDELLESEYIDINKWIIDNNLAIKINQIEET